MKKVHLSNPWGAEEEQLKIFTIWVINFVFIRTCWKLSGVYNSRESSCPRCPVFHISYRYIIFNRAKGRSYTTGLGISSFALSLQALFAILTFQSINWSRCSFCKERLERMSSLSKEWRGDSFFMKRDSLFTMLFPFLCPKQKSKSLFIALCKRLHCPCRPLKEWWERIALSLFTKRVT